MKTTQKDFEFFKKECQKWIDKLKLDNWNFNFWHKDLKGSNADCRNNLNSYVCDITLDTKIETDKPIEEELKRIAKHEIIHTLLARLSINGSIRHIGKEELEECEEELVRKLEKLL